MATYRQMTQAERAKEYKALQKAFENCKAKGLKLDMSRGKPGKEQLDRVNGLLDVIFTYEDFTFEGFDTRNYGALEGLPCARRYFADVLGTKPEEVFVGGNASLQLMYDVISKAYTHGLLHSEQPWAKLDTVKFLCPAPGYDRHFKISETFGAELVYIPMTPNGPDMDAVEEAVKDPAVKGIWCVPKYSNPDGIIYSDETIHRLASLRPAAKDFLLMWDNAYCVHEFDGEFVPFPDILSLCREAGNPDMVYEFASTSKITFPGAGVACFAASEANIAYMSKLISFQVISFDKMNQLRHAMFLKDKAHTVELMRRHAAILKPKFDVVLRQLQENIAPLQIATWNSPKGGYFVSLDTMPGCAKRTLELCKEAGVVMTTAGATFPYGKDPNDANIRIAPSFPPVAELELAMEVFCVCLKMAALEKLGL